MTNVTVEIPEDVLTLADLPDGSASSRATQRLDSWNPNTKCHPNCISLLYMGCGFYS
jgi:hypothetical protein